MDSSQNKAPRTPLAAWLFVLVVLAVLAVMIATWIANFYFSRDMVWALGQSRALQIGTQMMTLDTNVREHGMEWTSKRENGRVQPATLGEYLDALVAGKYFPRENLSLQLTVAGKGPGSSPFTAQNIGFKFFLVDEKSPSDQPLIVTANWADRQLTDAAPFGRKAFVVFAKGGSGGISEKEAEAGSSNLFPIGPDYRDDTIK